MRKLIFVMTVACAMLFVGEIQAQTTPINKPNQVRKGPKTPNKHYVYKKTPTRVRVAADHSMQELAEYQEKPLLDRSRFKNKRAYKRYLKRIRKQEKASQELMQQQYEYGY